MIYSKPKDTSLHCHSLYVHLKTAETYDKQNGWNLCEKALFDIEFLIIITVIKGLMDKLMPF